jgi:CDP-diacylglycerol---glycerol-3-phosphate 3-phosphatidyltransferase
MRPVMFRHVPNALTASRLLLAAVFFVLLSFYQYDGRGHRSLLNIAFIIYVIALVTDFLDGYLARRWKVEGTFGRVVDPFCDKVLVLGAFTFFAGKNFILPDPEQHYWVRTITGVAPWMVVIILSRELLVTSLRAVCESAGQSFGAVFSGKFKMAFQSATVMVILVYVNYFAALRFEQRYEAYAIYGHIAWWICQATIYATLIITVYSGLTYVQRAVVLFRSPATPAPKPHPPPAAARSVWKASPPQTPENLST